MKKMILMACIIGISIISVKTYGGPITGDYNKAIQDYIKSHMDNDFKKLNEVMDEDATLKTPRGDSVIIHHKSELVDQMRTIGITNQICVSNYEVLEKSDALVIARVDFDYHFAVQHDFLIIEKNTDKQWKITEICKIIEDKTT